MKKLNIVKPQRASYQKQTIDEIIDPFIDDDEIIDPFIDDDEIIDKWNGQNVNGASKAIAVDTLFTETLIVDNNDITDDKDPFIDKWNGPAGTACDII